MGIPRMPVAECRVSEQVLSLGLLAEGLSLSPNPGRAELRVLGGAVAVCSEEREPQILGEVKAELKMRVEVQSLLVVLLLKEDLRVIDIGCGVVLDPVLVCIITCRTGGVLSSGRVEHHLIVEQVLDLVRGAEDSEIHGKKVIECLLVDVQLGDKILVSISADDVVPVCVSYGSTVVRRLRTSAEGEVMVVDYARAGYDIRRI